MPAERQPAAIDVSQLSQRAARRRRRRYRGMRLSVWAGTLLAVALTMAAARAAGARAASAAPGKLASGWTSLKLENGWTGSPFRTSAPAVRSISGIVHLRGGMDTNGPDPVAFTLPAGFRPTSPVFVTVDQCDATTGRLQIEPTGVVTVEAAGAVFSSGACFTSLDGVSFAKSAASFTPLTLQNGWTGSAFGTSAPALRSISGIVHLTGGISTTGSNPVPFTLPAGFRPVSTVFVPVDLCNAASGVLQIEPTGVVTVQASAFSNAACFTSLDGVSFATSGKSFTSLKLRNGWFKAPFGNSGPSVRSISGIVRLRGAIGAVGTNAVPFTLPREFRPARAVFVPVDMCTSTSGRLQIEPTGVVTVQEQGGGLSNAGCFTSLDGVSFAAP